MSFVDSAKNGNRRYSGTIGNNKELLNADTIGSNAARNIRKDGGSVSIERQTLSTQYGTANVSTIKGKSNNSVNVRNNR
jgi:hypothetical protein